MRAEGCRWHGPGRASLSVLAAIGIASCGLLSPDPPSLAGTRDPAFGFVDGPGIEVCLAGTRVVGPGLTTADALSLCIPTGATPRSCVTSSTCALGERCLCGRCVASACRNSTECAGGEVCQGSLCLASCSADADCGPQEFCAGGACARRCTSRATCGYGETCSALDGTCIAKLCGPTLSCGDGDSCVEQERVAEIREPHVLSSHGSKIAYLELRESAGGVTTCDIYRARVVTPRRWELDPTTPVLEAEPEDEGCIGAPSVLTGGSELVLFGASGDGAGLLRARSSDGIEFDREPGWLWSPQIAWEQGWVGSPGVIASDNRVLLFYTAARGGAIGLLSLSHPLGDATPFAEEPWLVPADFEDPLFWRSIERIGAPFPVSHEGQTLVYATVRGAEGSDALSEAVGFYPADINDSIGVVATHDLVHWERFPVGPVFARRTNLRAFLGEREPSVLIEDDTSWLVYVASDASGDRVTGLGLASTP